MAFPADHWRSISSTNAIERVNAEIDRRTKVVGHSPPQPARLATAVVQDQHDEWQDDRRLFGQQSMARMPHPDGPPAAHPSRRASPLLMRAPPNSHYEMGLDRE